MKIKKEHYHTIRTQEFAISIDDETRAYEVQSEISAIHHAQLESCINKILNKFSDDRYIFRFDHIELNLGTIAADAMSRDIPLKIEEALTHYLQNALSEYRASSNYEKIEVYDTLVEQLEYFLIHGYFNWNAYTNTTATSLFDDLKVNSKQELKILLLKLGKVESIRKRIINQFLDPTIEGIVEVVAEEESIYILEYRLAITKHQQKERIVESETTVFRNALWEIILAYVFLESKSFYNKKNYLEYLIKKIAEKYNQTYENLLLALYKGVESANLPYGGSQNDFKKIVNELKEEINPIDNLIEDSTALDSIDSNELEQILITLFVTQSAFQSIHSNKIELLSRIQFYIKNNVHFVRFIVDKLLSSFELRTSFLAFLDAPTLDLLFEKIGSTKMRISLSIIENLFSNRAHLTSLPQSSFMELYHQRKKFVLLHFFNFSGSKESLFHFTLERVTNEMAINNTEAIVWLLKATEQMKSPDKKIVHNYLKKQDNYNQISDLKKEIVQFLSSNEPKTWLIWLESKLLIWRKLSQFNESDWEFLISNELKNELPTSIYESFLPILKKVNFNHIEDWPTSNTSKRISDLKIDIHPDDEKKFLNHLIENLSITILKISLETHYSEKWYVQVAELINDSAFTYSIPIKQLHDKLLQYYTITKPNELIVWRLGKLKSNNFLNQDIQQNENIYLLKYIIENGLLPCWVDSYSWNNFNIQLGSALKESVNRKAILASLKKSSSVPVVFLKLNPSIKRNLFYELIVGFQSTSSKNWLKELVDFLAVEAHFSGSISSTYYYEFESRLFTLLLSEKLSATSIEKNTLVYVSELLKHASKPASYDAKRIFQIIDKYGSAQLIKRLALIKQIKPFWEAYLIENSKDGLSSLFSYLRMATTAEIKAVLNNEKIIVQALQSIEIRQLLVTKLTSNELLLLFSIWSKTPYFDTLSRAITLLHVTHNTDLVAGKLTLLDVFISHLLQSKKTQKTQQSLMGYNSFPWLQSITKQGKLGYFIASLLDNKERFSPYLIHMFENEETRNLLIRELSLKDLIIVVKYRLSPNQLSIFDRSIKVLDYFFQRVSTQEKKQLNRVFFGLLISKISTSSTLQYWNIQNWMWLVYHSLEITLGKSKKNQVLVQVVDSKLSYAETKEELITLIELAQKKDTTKLLEEDVTIKLEKPYKKLGEELSKELLNPIYIKHAGLVILAPYLKMLFEKCQLFNAAGEFKDTQSRQKAIHLLEFAAFGHNEYHEHDLVINKVLCGMELSDSIDRSIYLSESERDIVNSLLKAVTQQWGALKETSISGLRETFLQRYGRLEEEEEQYYLKVEKKAFDMLLDQIPWNISTIKLSWMKKMLIVEWR